MLVGRGLEVAVFKKRRKISTKTQGEVKSSSLGVNK